MADKEPPQEPAEAPVIRLAENLLRSELVDFMVIKRHKDGTFDFCASNLTWALGAVDRVAGMLDRVEQSGEDHDG